MVLQQNDSKQDEIFLALVPIDSTLLAVMGMSASELHQGGLGERTPSEILKMISTRFKIRSNNQSLPKIGNSNDIGISKTE